MAILYCDCFSGISGDMFLAALLDAGLPEAYLTEQLARLGLAEFHGLSVERVKRGALAAALLKLEIDPSPARHRHLTDIRALIEPCNLPEAVKQLSLSIFQKLAEAEAQVHGVPIEKVHFHEVGAVDSILDIVGAAVGLHFFDIQAIYASALPLGAGQVQTQHGLLPLPAPATMALLTAAQAPVRPSPATFEMVTPTGAAILAALAKFEQPEMRLMRTGVGAGRRDLDWPNVLRVMIGESEWQPETHVEIETNIDDMNPQILGHVMTILFQAGALDVYFTPIYMKKNRPATKLSVIARTQEEDALCALILRETSTLGLRVSRVWRHEADREIRNVSTAYGDVPVKLKILNGQVIQAAPEFDVCAKLADAAGVPVQQVLRAAEAAGRTVE